MRHRVKVSPVRVHSYNAELAYHVVTVVAYRAVCSCGWRSPASAKFGQARTVSRGHLAVVKGDAAITRSAP